MTEEFKLLTPLEKDALQEIMNISFGQAAADLSDVINLYVTLAVPHIDLLALDQVLGLIEGSVDERADLSMVKQFFSGKFSGTSVLIFPRGEGKKLLRLFDENADLSLGSFDSDMMERESLVEISNIIMGACVSNIAGLLKDAVVYTPPRYYSHDQIKESLEAAFPAGESLAIFFRTTFNFKDSDASGFLFLICDHLTLDWLKESIGDYLEQYT